MFEVFMTILGTKYVCNEWCTIVIMVIVIFIILMPRTLL